MKEKINLNWWAININRAKTRKDLLNSFDKKLFSQGKISAEVENEICKKIKSKYCILTPSGTSAIVLSLMYFKMRVNDPKKNEVLFSSIFQVCIPSYFGSRQQKGSKKNDYL